MLLPMCLQDSKSSTLQDGGGHKENHPSGWNRGPLTEGHVSSLLAHRHKPCPSDGDVGVGLSDETEAEGQT